MANLLVLGSGGPVPNPDRFGTAHVVQSGGRNFLFDCGPATTYKLSKLSLSALDFDHLFISHHHFDHVADLPAFLLTRWDHSIGVEDTLQVYGPVNTEEMIDRLVGNKGAFAFDWNARVNHPLSERMHQLRGGKLPRPKPEFDVNDVIADRGPVEIASGAGFKVTAQRVEHVQPELESIAYRLDTDEISIVFTGDARPCDHLVELAASCPVELKLAQQGKGVLKEIARGMIPDAIIDRPKGYFPMPALKYVRGEFYHFMADTLNSQRSRNRGLFNRAYIDKLLDQPEQHFTRLNGSKLWHSALLEYWLQNHLD